MIRINLLPADLRRGNRVSPKVLGACFGAALAVSGAVGWFGLVYFGDLAAAEDQLQSVEAKLSQRQPKVKYHDDLETNRKDYSQRVQTIQEIGNSRRVWSKFLDELIDVVNNNGDTERHLAWLDSVTVKGDPKKGAKVTIPGNVQDADKSRLANFHEDIEAAAFFADVSLKTDPQWTLEYDATRIPPAFLKFPLELQFNPSAAPKK